MQVLSFLYNPGLDQFLSTGTLVLASSAWYTTTIVNDFFSYKAEDNFIIFEIGPTLFLAYIASFLCFITTILCFCLPGPGPDRRGNKFKNFTFSLSREDKHFKKFTSGKRVEEYIWLDIAPTRFRLFCLLLTQSVPRLCSTLRILSSPKWEKRLKPLTEVQVNVD